MDQSPPMHPAYAGLPLTRLKRGETKSVHADLKIQFEEVQDEGRCPADMECFHAGWATIEVKINGAEQTLTLRGGNASVFHPPEGKSAKEGSGNMIDVGIYRVFLVALDPYPVSTVKADMSRYEAVFIIDTVRNQEIREKAKPLVGREQALEIAQTDAAKGPLDLSSYKVEAELKEDGWHVAYGLKKPQPGGGGPEYVIDPKSGVILSKWHQK